MSRFLHLRLLASLLLFASASMHLSAADLFGGDGDGPSLGQQKEAYVAVFGKADAAAEESRKERLPFAQKLDQHLEDPDFALMRDYMCIRIKKLLEKEKSFEGYRILLHVFDLEHQDKVPDAAACAALEELLYTILKKAPAAEQRHYAQRLVDLHRYVLRTACFRGDMELADKQIKSLDKLYKILEDTDSRLELKRYAAAVKEAKSQKYDFIDLQNAASAADASAEQRKAFIRYCLQVQRPQPALPVAQALADAGEPELLTLLQCLQTLLAGEGAVSHENAGRGIFAIQRLLQDEPGFFLETRLLNLGLALRDIVATAGDEMDKQVVLRCKLATGDWESRLEDRPLFWEQIGQAEQFWHAGGGRSGSFIVKGLRETDVIELYVHKMLIRSWPLYIAERDAGPEVRLLPLEDTKIWTGVAPVIPFDPQSAVLVIDLCHSTVAAHPLDGMEATLDKMMEQFKNYRGQVVFRTLILKSEQNMKIMEGGDRFIRQQEFFERLTAYAQEHKIPVIDCYTPSLEAWKRSKNTVYHADIYANKYSPEGERLVFELLAHALGIELKD